MIIGFYNLRLYNEEGFNIYFQPDLDDLIENILVTIPGIYLSSSVMYMNELPGSNATNVGTGGGGNDKAFLGPGEKNILNETTNVGTGGEGNGRDGGAVGASNATNVGTGGASNATNVGTGGASNATNVGTGGGSNATNVGTGGEGNGSDSDNES